MYVKRSLIALVSVLALLVAAGADAERGGKGKKGGGGGSSDPDGGSAACYTLSAGAEPTFDADGELDGARLEAQFDASECGRVRIEGSLEWVVDRVIAADSQIADNQASASATVSAQQLMESDICLRAHGTLQELKGNGDPKGDPVPFDEMVCL